MSTSSKIDLAQGQANLIVPPLKTGQRLSQVEFEQRYEDQPELKKAELIEGVVSVASPVRIKRHGRPHHHLVTWSGLYCAATLGVWGADNGTIRLDDKNELQPDLFLSLEPELGGRSRISEDDYLEGPPELIIEIAASSASKDLSDKHQVYARHGVLEYVVVQTISQRIDWFVLHEHVYEVLAPDEEGILRSEILPGLWLQAAAFWANDMKTVLAVLQQGLDSPEHAAFVERLGTRR